MKRWLLNLIALAAAMALVTTASLDEARAQDGGLDADLEEEDEVVVDDIDDQTTSSLDEGPPVRHLTLLRSGRFELQPQVSFTMNDPFVRNIGFGAGIAYYFTNSLGVGADYVFAPVQLDTDETAGVASSGFSPRVQRQLSVAQVQMAFDLGLIYVPVFGKFSLFDLVLHYDLHLFAGAGGMVMEARCVVDGCEINDDLGGPKFAGAIGFGSRLYFNNWLALNLEFRDLIGPWAEYARGSSDDRTEVRQMFIGTVGVSFFFPFNVYISR